MCNMIKKKDNSQKPIKKGNTHKINKQKPTKQNLLNNKGRQEKSTERDRSGLFIYTFLPGEKGTGNLTSHLQLCNFSSQLLQNEPKITLLNHAGGGHAAQSCSFEANLVLVIYTLQQIYTKVEREGR